MDLSQEKSLCKHCLKEIDKYQSYIVKGKRYYAKKKLNSYCSQECASLGRRKRKIINCLNCNKEIEIQDNCVKSRKFCSKECWHKFERPIKTTKESDKLKSVKIKKRKTKSISTPKVINCVVCQTEFVQKNSNSKYCSDKCSWRGSQPKHKEARKNRIYARKAELILQNGGCCNLCGYKKCGRAMTFHHIDPSTKKFTLDSGNLFRYTWDAILEESKKCQLLCQNCHAELHERERNLNANFARADKREKYRTRKSYAIAIKGGCCELCGYTNDGQQSFTFHHIDKTQKSFPLDSVAFCNKKDNEILEELNKCQLLCFNCHMEIEDSLKE